MVEDLEGIVPFTVIFWPKAVTCLMFKSAIGMPRRIQGEFGMWTTAEYVRGTRGSPKYVDKSVEIFDTSLASQQVTRKWTRGQGRRLKLRIMGN